MDDNSSVGSIQSDIKDSVFRGSLENESSVALANNLAAFIKWNCNVSRRKIALTDVKQLIAHPTFIKNRDRYEIYSKELLSILESMLETVHMQPLQWFKGIDFSFYAQRLNLTEQEFHNELSILSQSVNGYEWSVSDSNILFSHICSKHSSGVNPHNLKVAFKKSKLSTKKIERLNKAGSLLSRIGIFLARHNLNLEDFTSRKTEVGFKDIDSMVSQLLYTYIHARNAPNAMTRVGDVLMNNLHSDNASTLSAKSGNSFGSSLSHRRELLQHTGETPFKCGLAQRNVLSNNLGKDENYTTSVLHPPPKEPVDIRPWRRNGAQPLFRVEPASVSSTQHNSKHSLPPFNHETYMKAILVDYQEIVSRYDKRLQIAKRVMQSSLH
jgi:hypothetical protein